jgi:photosystem II stability/assembly factor-like uncharacterized protein
VASSSCPTTTGAIGVLAKSPTEATLTAVQFVDARRGFAVGHDAVILMTEDAGETGSRYAAPTSRSPCLPSGSRTHERGIAAAHSSFYRTDDGGKSWHAAAEFAGDLHFNALAGGADGKLFLVGESGLIVRSEDAGRSWTTMITPYKGSYFGILRVAESTWLAYGLRGNAFRTNDDGARWNLVSPGSAQASLMGGTQLPDGGVLLVGREGTLLASRNRGNSFTARKTGRQGARRRAAAAVRRLRAGRWAARRSSNPATSAAAMSAKSDR